MELKVGDKCELEVIDLCSNSKGTDYIEALGPDDHVYNIFNIIKCQFTSLPDTIYGEVVGSDAKGNLRIRQDEQRVYQEHYELGKFYAFTIADQAKDKNDAQYYLIEDDFASQRWYSKDKHAIGEDIILEAKSISANGFIYFAPHKTPKEVQVITQPQIAEYSTPSGNYPVFGGPDEDQYVEYKTSIVFTSKSQPDIDAQCLEIAKELAAFMNAEGGTLYIGIHDKTREILGFSQDLQYLNTGSSEYASSYTPDEDHYELKIRDMLVQYTSGTAGSLIKVTFEEVEGARFCKVHVDKASFPVWVKGTLLYERQGNQKRLLRGDAITQFVCKRMASAFQSAAPKQGVSVDNLADTIQSAVYDAINRRREEVAAPKEENVNKTPKYWIVWLDDGKFVKMRNESDSFMVKRQLPVYEDGADMMVVFCFKSGTVNRVEFSKFRRGANYDKARPNGMNMEKELIDVFITHTSSLLAIYSADQGGTEYVKIHHLTDVNTTESGKNAGSYVVPTSGAHILKCKLLTAVEANNAKALIAAKSETRTLGHNIHDITVQKEIEYLDSL